MSKVIQVLKNYSITDSGEVLMQHSYLKTLLRDEKSIHDLIALPNPDIEIYNRTNPSNPLKKAEIDEVPEGLCTDVYKFRIPESYLVLDIDEDLVTKLLQVFGAQQDIYINRLALELRMIHDRHMEDLIRTLIYMVDVFNNRGVVHGIGRGSSCASLVLFLIGIHMVDPVLYEIPIGEFLR